MANSSMFLIILVIFSAFLAATSMARLLTTNTTSSSTLAARLKLDGNDGQDGGRGSPNCWDMLFELQSCTGEVILFFLNGETFLGQGCCKAIENIEHNCWPSMLGSLGFTSQEGNILLGYCDASSSHNNRPPATPPPQTANTTTTNQQPTLGSQPSRI